MTRTVSHVCYTDEHRYDFSAAYARCAACFPERRMSLDSAVTLRRSARAPRLRDLRRIHRPSGAPAAASVDRALIELIRWMNRVVPAGRVEPAELVRLYEWITNNRELLNAEPVSVLPQWLHAISTDTELRPAERLALEMLNDSVARRTDRRRLTAALKELLGTRRPEA